MKKMMTSLLAIVMLLSLCAGCGSKESAAPASNAVDIIGTLVTRIM